MTSSRLHGHLSPLGLRLIEVDVVSQGHAAHMILEFDWHDPAGRWRARIGLDDPLRHILHGGQVGAPEWVDGLSVFLEAELAGGPAIVDEPGLHIHRVSV